MQAPMSAPFKPVIDGGGMPADDQGGDPFAEFRQSIEGMDPEGKRQALKQFEAGMMEHVREQLSDVYEEIEGPAEEEAEPASEYPEEEEMHGDGAMPAEGAMAAPMAPPMMPAKTMMGARR